MRTDKIGKNIIEVWDGLDEIPMQRYFQFNKYALIESGLGSTIEQVDSHISKVINLIHQDEKELATQEMLNMRKNIYLVLDQTSPELMSYACRIKTINGENPFPESEGYRISEEDLENVVNRLCDMGASKSFFDKALEAIKKKMTMISQFISRTFRIRQKIKSSIYS